jgi:hypothetical protein
MKKPLNKAQAKLVRQLRELDACSPALKSHHYHSPYDFLLQHGQWYKPRPYPPRFYIGLPKMCFGNSIVVAVEHGLRYVEGFMLMPLILGMREGVVYGSSDCAEGLAIHHAWNTDAKGRLYDSTLENSAFAYLGAEFAVERADDCTWNGNNSVLFDEHRGYPLLKEPWKGEPEGVVWPPSERLECLRHHDLEALEKLMQETCDDTA